MKLPQFKLPAKGGNNGDEGRGDEDDEKPNKLKEIAESVKSKLLEIPDKVRDTIETIKGKLQGEGDDDDGPVARDSLRGAGNAANDDPLPFGGKQRERGNAAERAATHELAADAGRRLNKQRKADHHAEVLMKYKAFEEIDEGPKYWIDTPASQMFIGVVVMVNALIIGLETDMNFIDGSAYKAPYWFVLSILFSVIFFIEMVIKFYYHKWEYFYHPGSDPQIEITSEGLKISGKVDYWNCTDFTLVVLGIIDVGIAAATDGGGDLKVLSVLRVVRMARLARLVRLLKIFKQLWLIVSGLAQSMKTLGWVSILLVLLIYVCAIFLTMQIGHAPEIYQEYKKLSGGWDHEEFFGTVARSMYTLFQILTLEGWASGIVRHVMSNQPGMVIFFLLYLLCTTFGLLNLVVGIIVENTLASARNNEEKVKQQQEKERKRILEHLHEIFDYAEKTKKNEITKESFMACLKRPEVSKKLKLIDLPMSEAEELFKVLDSDNQGTLDIEEFIGGCLRLKGSAKSKDLLNVQIQVECLAKKMDDLEETLSEKERKMDALEKVTIQMSRRYESSIEDAHRRMALAIGGGAPMIKPKSKKREVDLSVGNKPMLPPFPSFLH